MDMQMSHNVDWWAWVYAGVCQIVLIGIVVVEYLLPSKSVKISAEELKRLREESAQGEIQAARSEEEMQRLTVEAKKLKTELQEKTSVLVLKEREMQQLTAELEQLRNQSKAGQSKAEEVLLKEKEIQRLNAELERVNNEQKSFEERLAELKKAELDIHGIETLLDQEKKALHEIKLRAQEAKMKFQLLNDKAKESVELIAQFAQGKEFDEFRKSIHLDEVVQKYEDQISALKLENSEKKPKG